MNQTIEQRFQSIEDELKEIRKELEESFSSLYNFHIRAGQLK